MQVSELSQRLYKPFNFLHDKRTEALARRLNEKFGQAAADSTLTLAGSALSLDGVVEIVDGIVDISTQKSDVFSSLAMYATIKYLNPQDIAKAYAELKQAIKSCSVDDKGRQIVKPSEIHLTVPGISPNFEWCLAELDRYQQSGHHSWYETVAAGKGYLAAFFTKFYEDQEVADKYIGHLGRVTLSNAHKLSGSAVNLSLEKGKDCRIVLVDVFDREPETKIVRAVESYSEKEVNQFVADVTGLNEKVLIFNGDPTRLEISKSDCTKVILAYPIELEGKPFVAYTNTLRT